VKKQEVPGNSGLVILFCIVVLGMMFGFSPQMVAASEQHDKSRHLYERIMLEFKHGDYNAALAGFKFYLELHGKSALAANAQYWIGECEYRLGRYTDALKSFSNVGSINPLSSKVAASAFKIGQTYWMLGDYYRARMTYDEVLDHYPGGAEAHLARKAIEGMALKTPSKAVRAVNHTQ
jgi:tol-pal system protein YbgF